MQRLLVPTGNVADVTQRRRRIERANARNTSDANARERPTEGERAAATARRERATGVCLRAREIGGNGLEP